MSRLAWCALAAIAPLFAADPSAPFFFTNTVYPVLEEANCRGCHTQDGVASATRVRFPEPKSHREVIEAFGRSLAAVVDRKDPARSLLVMKPTNQVSHGGGERIRHTSAGEQTLLAWVTRLAALPPESSAAGPAAVAQYAAARRLTHNQYNRTIRDLLGDDTRPARQFPGEDFVDGFNNQSAAQSVSPLLAESYLAAAEKTAANAFRFGDVHGIVPCKPRTASDSECASAFVKQFGLRAYRRALTSTEHQAFVGLLLRAARQQNEFLAGARLVVEAMLDSPNFLFRLEHGDKPLDSFEIASRLSYALWDTMPDDELLRAAAAGKLTTPAEVERQARRMLRDPRAREAIDEFTSQWLRFDRLFSSLKDRRMYPQFSPSLLDAMAEETRRLIRHLVWEDRPFTEIFSAGYSFLNPELAGLYGIPAPSAPFALTPYPADSERAGVLGHGTFLAQTGKPEETSPTERGLFIREHFLCQGVPPPPPGVNVTLPAFALDVKPVTNRERMTKLHLTNPSCAGCHVLIDPIGFGLERFDTMGQWHAKQPVTVFPRRDQRFEAKQQEFELELDTSASIRGIPDSDFSSAKALGRVLASDPTCQKCIVRQWFRFALGRRDTEADRTDVDRAFAAFRQSGFRFQEMMVALMKTDVFRGARPAAKDSR